MDINASLYPLYMAFREANKGSLMVESGLAQSDSFSSLSSKVAKAINDNIQAGIDMDGDDDGVEDAKSGAYAWVQDLYPNVVVYSMGGCLFQCDYSVDSSDKVTLGTPKEVEMAYQPVAESASKTRQMTHEVESLKESAYDSTKGELTVTVIRPGKSKNHRFYPAEVLKRDHKIFEGAKMFADHQTESESKQRPEGSVNNWVAVLGKPWAESDGTIMAKATVVDPPFKAKLDRLNETGLLGEMGISIRAVGEAYNKTENGETVKMVESLLAARSVDFVTYAGAGGRVEAIESATDENDVDVVSESELRKRRPDLVTLIESNAPKDKAMKTLEEQLKEATDKLAILEAEKTVAVKAAAQASISNLLTESKLPALAQAKLKKQFEASTSIEGVAEAILAEVEYLAAVAPTATVAKKNGAEENASESSDPVKTKTNLTEAFKLIGLDEASAKIAATGRR